MILYFSGTGNSRYAAQVIQSITGDEIRSINELMKAGWTGTLKSDKPFVFVMPSYCVRMPKVVDKFIADNSFEGSGKAYFVMTCGACVGDAERYMRNVCKSKDFEFMGLGAVVMPENYIVMYPVPGKEAADAEIQKATPEIAEFARTILCGDRLTTDKKLTANRMLSYVANPVFYGLLVNAKGFHSTDKCTSCGKCVQLCPLNNVQLVDGKPRWGKACTHCMACICGCPSEAIEYNKTTQGKPRFFNQGYQLKH